MTLTPYAILPFLLCSTTTVWKKLKGSKPEGSKKDQIEEFEDTEGNVFNKKTYEDLKRQGLI
jgi:splicing factor 3A subunit 3